MRSLLIKTSTLSFKLYLSMRVLARDSFSTFHCLVSSQQVKISFWKMPKKTAPCENNNEEVSFEWSHHRILFTQRIVRTTLYGIINSTTGKYCSVAFILLEWLHRRTWLTDVNYTFTLHVPILTVEMPNYDTYFKIGCNSLSSSANIK